MKISKVFAILTLILSGVLILSQVLQVNAEFDKNKKPATNFSYIMKGKITFIFTGKPISSVIIKAKNKKTDKVIETSTNSKGEYTIQAEKGIYVVTPFSSQVKRFMPLFHLVTLYTNITGVNFVGNIK